MTDDLFSSVATTEHSHMVPFRTSGAGSPLFCFPGSGGNVYIFREMAMALPEGRPVYALDMEWLCDAGQDFTIEQLAAFCLNAIRKIQKSGPYHFCGYSFGGLVAYEIATRLIDEGDSAALVSLLDAPNPALMSNLSGADSAKYRKTYLIDRLTRYGRQLVQGDIRGFTDRGFAFITSRAGRFFMPLIKSGFRIANRPLPAVLRANDPGFLRAWNAYVPRRYPKRIVCFRTQDRGPEHDNNPSMGWDVCATGGIDLHIVPGGHVDMMAMPSVRVVADTLATYLDNGAGGSSQPVGSSQLKVS